MYSWKSYDIFSSMFLAEYHDTVLYDVLHQIVAFLLFPINCSCKTLCQCDDFRERVILTLNVTLYINDEKAKKSPAFLNNIRFLLRIPEPKHFRENFHKAYPLWLIKEDFRIRDKDNYFKGIESFVWKLLRSDNTDETLPFRKSSAIAKEEKNETVLLRRPLKTNVIKFQKKDDSTSGKISEKRFDTYKSICHFIAAYEFMKREKGQEWQFSLNQPDQVQRFLDIAYWFRKSLLSLKTGGDKENILFSEEDLVPLPAWVQDNEIDIPIEPFDNKVHEPVLAS
ncbi:MAG: hypothetical protein BGO67_10420 [Alphaproteobacteria bacterium 41-28]|nr:MAG: hypothetical protein BGO67_10420 [Alphaproteobacteria bacterium 41-28]